MLARCCSGVKMSRHLDAPLPPTCLLCPSTPPHPLCRMIADTLMWLVQKTAQDLLFMPFSEEEAAQATAKLPEPMQPGGGG